MAVFQDTIHINTTKQFQLFPITEQIKQVVEKSAISAGICAIYIPHTTAALRINDNESLLHQDIMKMIYRLAPMNITYGHDQFESRNNVKAEERSNGHAHVKAFFMGSSESIPFDDKNLLLGEHQEIFLVEFDGPRERTVQVSILGGT